MEHLYSKLMTIELRFIRGHRHFAIKNLPIDSPYMKDSGKKASDYATFLVVDGITIHAII